MNKLTIENFVFPKELFDHWKLPTDTGVLKYDDRPVTVRSVLEVICALRFNYTREMYDVGTKLMSFLSHDKREELAVYLINALDKVKDWGSYETTPISLDDADMFLRLASPELLYYAEDKIRFLLDATKGLNYTHLLIRDGLSDGVNFDLIGVTHAKIFAEAIEYATTFDGGLNAASPIQFFKNHYKLNISTIAIQYRTTYRNSTRLGTSNTGKGALFKLSMLLTPYFDTYRNWTDSGKYYVAKSGDRIYFSNHSVRDLQHRVSLENYIRNHPIPEYRNRLPYGIHPKIYFAPLIEQLVEEQVAHAKLFQTPEALVVPELKGSVRQLTKGVDLLNEGNVMKHCIGGQNYLEHLASAGYMFFHIDVPGFRYGATASFKSSVRIFRNNWNEGEIEYDEDDRYRYNYLGREWVIDDFRGIENASTAYLDSEFAIAADKAMRKILSENFRGGTPLHENYVIIDPLPIPERLEDPMIGGGGVKHEVTVRDAYQNAAMNNLQYLLSDKHMVSDGCASKGALSRESTELQNLIKQYLPVA